MNGARRPSGDPHAHAGPSRASYLAVGALLAGAGIAAALISPLALVLVVGLVCGTAGAELGADVAESGLSGSPLLYGVAVIAFPVAAYLWKEPGITAAAAALVLLAAGRFVLGRPERGAVISIAALILSALYIGFGSAYLILLRRRAMGGRLVAGLIVVAVVYHLCRWLGDTYVGKRSLARHLTNTTSVPGVALGMIGCFVATAGFLAFLHRPVHALLVLQVGLSLGVGLTFGSFAWALMRPEALPAERSQLPTQVLGVVQGVVMVAPALFYAARIVLR